MNKRVVEIKGRPLINFQRYTRFIDRLEKIFRLPPPDLERHRSQGQLAYLEGQLEKVRVDKEAENELVKRSQSIQTAEELLWRRRVPELRQLGFGEPKIPRRPPVEETPPIVKQDNQTGVEEVEALLSHLQLGKK